MSSSTLACSMHSRCEGVACHRRPDWACVLVYLLEWVSGHSQGFPGCTLSLLTVGSGRSCRLCTCVASTSEWIVAQVMAHMPTHSLG